MYKSNDNNNKVFILGQLFTVSFSFFLKGFLFIILYRF